VKQFLVSAGVSADRVSTVSFGKEKPSAGEQRGLLHRTAADIS